MFLVPANTKKSTLVLGFMRWWPDVFILAFGLIFTIALLLAFSESDSTWITLVACIPLAISGILVLPIPNYHNTLVALQSIFRFYNERRNYIWRGWCIYDEFKNDEQ